MLFDVDIPGQFGARLGRSATGYRVRVDDEAGRAGAR